MTNPLFFFELIGPFGTGGELAQSRERRRLAVAEFGKDLVDDAIQLVGGLSAGDARLAGEPFGYFRFLHADSMLPGENEGKARCQI
jgi:hypothetical protein